MIAQETARISIDIPTQTINDLIITALEGGIEYWSSWKCFDVNGIATRLGDNPVGNVVILISDLGLGTTHEINCITSISSLSSDLNHGLIIMSRDYPEHFQHVLTNSCDCENADVFIQCCIFGKIKYG